MVNRREFRFTIDAYTPETIPMARLAEYMAQIAVLLGEPSNVHFIRIEPGSLALVQLVQWIEPEAVPKVENRLEQIRRGDGPPEAINAFKMINRKLREDNSIGVLSTADDKEIIHFPGRETVESWVFGPFSQQGSLDGVVIRVGGKNELVPVLLESGPDLHYTCIAHRDVAKRLAPHIFTTSLRVYGTGRWHRDEEGRWILDRFIIGTFDVLSDEPLSPVVAALRSVPGSEWPNLEDPWVELSVIRNDTDEHT
jgi:hypothetical protein